MATERETEENIIRGVDIRTQRIVGRYVLWPGWAVTGLLALFFGLTGAEIPEIYRYIPLLISVVFLGLPHGAVDHLIPSKMMYSGNPYSHTKEIANVSLLYLFLGGAYLGAWFVSPLVSFVFFVFLTWFHWGQGDLYTSTAFGNEKEGRAKKVLTIVVRGGLPMVVPLISHPEVYRSVALEVTGVFSQNPFGEGVFFFTPEFRSLLLIFFSIFVVANIAVGYVSSESRDERDWLYVDTFEVLVLFLYFWFVPPVLAIGIYFCFWHSLRHIARLILIDEKGYEHLRNEEFSKAIRGFMIDAAPLTLVSIVLLGGLYFIVPHSGGIGNVENIVSIYLILISVLTLPHVVVVTWMDRKQKVWK